MSATWFVPAGFDLGEALKVAILSVTEGDDKPLKYPDAFAAASMMVLSKIDLLPHLDFDVGRCIEHARPINPDIAVLQVSARSGAGMVGWIDWLINASERAGAERKERRTAMHEMSIASALVDQVCDQAASLGAARVAEINLRMGVLNGIARSLHFCFPVRVARHAVRRREAEHRRGAAHGVVHLLRRGEDAGGALQFPLPRLRAAHAKGADGP